MIAYGHKDAWSYTPRQLAAFLFIAEKRRRREKAEDLALGVLASRGEMKAVKKQLKELEK